MAERCRTDDVSALRLKELVLSYGCREDLSRLLQAVERKDAILNVSQQTAVVEAGVTRPLAQFVARKARGEACD